MKQTRLSIDAFILGIVGALSAQVFMFLLRICEGHGWPSIRLMVYIFLTTGLADN